MIDLRCRKHEIALVPNGQGDWHCEQAQEGEEGCDSLTLADILGKVNGIGYVSYAS